MTLYDVTSQEHTWLLSFLRVEKQNTFPADYENEENNQLPFSTNQRRASTTTEELGKQCCQVRCSKIRKTLKNSHIYTNLFLLEFKFETYFSKSELKFPITNVNSSNLGENLHTWHHCRQGKWTLSSYVVRFVNILALITGISALICMTND